MICPIKRRNGRMVLGVVIIGTMVVKPPRTAADVVLYGIGTAAGLMLTDMITSGQMPAMSGGGCGCRK
jgi:hypothetical protein